MGAAEGVVFGGAPAQRNRRIIPNDDSALKSLFLAIREASKGWKAIHHWKPALQSFQVMFGEERVPLNAL